MDWYVIDKGYIDYLTSFDTKVGYADCGSRVKLHIGVFSPQMLPTNCAALP